MKRIAFLVLFLAATSGVALAQWAAVLGASTPSSAPFNIGDSTIEANLDSWGANIALLYRVQASASGTLQTGYIYFGATPTPHATCKIAIYNSSAASPQAGDTQVGISGTITGGNSVGWQSAAMTGGTVTSGNYYWVCIFNSTTQNVDVQSAHNATLYYLSSSGYYASPPANLGGVSSSLANYANFSAYVTAQ